MQVFPRDFEVSEHRESAPQNAYKRKWFLKDFSGLAVKLAPESSIFLRFYKGLRSGFSNGAKRCFYNAFLGLLAAP